MGRLDIGLSSDRRLHLAIIGGGAGAVEFIIHFLDAGAAKFPVSIDVFDPRNGFGRGIAWGDEKTPVLANMRVETLGPNYPESKLIQSLLRDIGQPLVNGQYPSRSAVGAALCERWRRVHATLPLNWTFKRIEQEAIDIKRDSRVVAITTADGASHPSYDLVCLSLGNLPAKRPPGLPEAARFINGWDVSAIEKIDPDSDVFIQGSGLTAIDVTMRLLAFGHRPASRSIVWQSKSGALPFIRPQQLKIEPKYLTLDLIQGLISRSTVQNKPLSLDMLWRLFELELKFQSRISDRPSGFATDYAGFVAMHDQLSDPAKARELMAHGIKGADAACLWFSVAKLFDEYVIPVVWNALPDEQKVIFLRDWRRDFDRFWAPIPVDNGKRVEQWLTEGTIQLLRTKIDLKADPKTGKFIFDPSLEDPLGEKSRAELQDRYKSGFDCAIDATGIQADLDNVESVLVANLLSHGTLVRHKFSADSGCQGARIEWVSGAVQGADGSPHGWLFTLPGSLTVGAHRFTNSYMAVSVSALRLATELFKQLTQ